MNTLIRSYYMKVMKYAAFAVPAARVYCSRCLVLWRYTEKWHFVRRSPPRPRGAGNEAIYLQEMRSNTEANQIEFTARMCVFVL